MPEVVYTGPFVDGVEIAETGQHAPQGEPIEVEADLAKRLLEQSDIWAKPSAKSSRKGDS